MSCYKQKMKTCVSLRKPSLFFALSLSLFSQNSRSDLFLVIIPQRSRKEGTEAPDA